MLSIIDATCINPKTYKCTKCRIPLYLCSFVGKETLTCLPSVHPLHTPCYSILKFGRHVTVFLRISNSLWCRCPILLCHNSNKLSLLCTKARTCSPRNLYKLPSLNPITLVVSRIKSFALMRTCWFLNTTANTLSFMTETERKIFLRPGTIKTSSKSKELLDSS